MVLTIRRAGPADHDAIWRIFHDIVAAGDTYAYPPDTSREEAMALWFPKGGWTFVAEQDGAIVATYVMKANQPGQGNHVANCGYMVDPAASGRGVGEALCRHSLAEARHLGFLAMQFNFVVATNTRAVELWKRCGFSIVGTVPGAFRHPTLGLVDAHVMYCRLEGTE
jgi:L-amino acid N-acyltransferase YncA